MPRHTHPTSRAVPASRTLARPERDSAHQAYRDCVRRLRAVRSGAPVTGSALHPGAVVWTRVEFEDIAEFKIRPAVVVARTARQVILVPLSSLRPGRRLVLLPEPAVCLPRPSGLVPRLIRVERADLITVAGVLSPVNTAFATAVAATVAW